MPGFGDSAVIVLLALLLFGPKKLPVLARQLGKLMGDFRRASNEFRSQMEEELRISEQADRQKQIAAIEAAAPPTPIQTLAEASASDPEAAEPTTEPLPIATSGELNILPPSTGLPVAKSPLGPLLDSIPEAVPAAIPAPETTSNGHSHATLSEPEPLPAEPAKQEAEARPWMI